MKTIIYRKCHYRGTRLVPICRKPKGERGVEEVTTVLRRIARITCPDIVEARVIESIKEAFPNGSRPWASIPKGHDRHHCKPRQVRQFVGRR